MMTTDITDEERRRRIDAARAEVRELRANPNTPRQSYWLSFADSDLPKGQQFLGALIVDDCVNLADAIEQSHRAKVNPGGAVGAHVLPKRAFEEDAALRLAPRLTLMDKTELLRRGLIEAPDGHNTKA